MRRLGLILSMVSLVAAGACAKSRIAVPAATEAQGDALALASRVRTALLNDAIVGLRRIDVQVTGDQVRLSGRVASAAERDRAVAIARAVEGVGGVTSDLQIQP